MAHKLLLALLLVVVPLPSFGEEQARLGFALGSDAITSTPFTLDLGIQVDAREKSIQLRVKNLLNTAQTVDVFKDGQSIDIRWDKPNDKMGLRSRTTLAGGDEETVTIRVRPDSSVDSLPVVLFLSSDTVVAAFAVAYRIDLPEKPGSTGGEFWSPYGLEGQEIGRKAHYKLCTGAPPIGYHMKADSLKISAHTIEGNHERSCGAWMDCTPTTPDVAGSVCHDIAIQGHWKGGNATSGDENERVKVAVRITWTYVLDEQVPTLRPYVKSVGDAAKAP